MKATEESYFKSHDNHRLYYEYYKCDKPKAILIFIHGVNEHSGRYKNPIRHFKKNYDLYLMDQRGFGKSDGIRSHIEGFDVFCRDLDEFVQFIALRQKRVKIFLIGHSMGGQVVLNYAAHYPRSPIAGFLLSSPNIRVAMAIHPIKKWAGKKLAKWLPKVRLASDLDPAWISRDVDVVQAYKKDPLVRGDITCRLAVEILANQEEIMELAHQIKKPIFLMHGGSDPICSAEATREFYEKLPRKTSSLKIYDKMLHEIFNEYGKEEVFEDMEGWLEQRL